MIAEGPKAMRTVSRKMKRHREPVSSYKVFCDHVRISHTGEVNVMGIFTQHCFQEWLATRPGRIKHPEQSFQRVLYAHIRGADRRRPFDEPVEKALIDILRHPKPFNPWTALFSGKSLQMGKKGFRRMGYHEAKRVENEEPRQEKKSENLSLAQRVSIPIEDAKNHELVKSETFLPVHDGFDVSAFASLLQESFTSNPHKNLKYDKRSPWDQLCEAIDTFANLKSNLKNSRSEARKRGIKAYSPGIYYFLNQDPPREDHRFDWDFIFPRRDQCHFDPDSPVANLYTNYDDVIIAEDENARALFGGSVMNYHLHNLNASLIYVMFSCIRFLPLSAENDIVWRRDFLKTLDGRTICVLSNIQYEDGRRLVQIQDQSSRFQTSLSAAPLLL